MTAAESDAMFQSAAFIARSQRAHAYAAQVRERNKPDCQCEACVYARMLPAVMQIAERWPVPQRAQKLRRAK